MVSDGISAQDLLNKSVTATVHYLTTIANSGYIVRRNSLTNMTTADLEQVGMKTGIVLEVDGPINECIQKIQPNNFPAGMDRMTQHGEEWVKATTGITDLEQGIRTPEESGVAVAMKQFQSKLSLAKPLSNLQFTRTLVGRKVMELIQQFITSERIYKITSTGNYGEKKEEELTVNKVDPSGAIINDITIGEYDVEVSTVPMASTYEESQFRQLIELRGNMQVAIPDAEIIMRSNLSNKQELADLMRPQENPADQIQLEILKKELEEKDAQIKLLLAKVDSEAAKTTNTNIQAMFGATNAAVQLATSASVAPAADAMLLSGGFKDHNAPPVIPQGLPTLANQPLPVVPQNTSPNYPPHADSGYNQGIEGGAE